MKGGDINCGQKGGIPGKRIFSSDDKVQGGTMEVRA